MRINLRIIRLRILNLGKNWNRLTVVFDCLNLCSFIKLFLFHLISIYKNLGFLTLFWFLFLLLSYFLFSSKLSTKVNTKNKNCCMFLMYIHKWDTNFTWRDTTKHTVILKNRLNANKFQKKRIMIINQRKHTPASAKTLG